MKVLSNLLLCLLSSFSLISLEDLSKWDKIAASLSEKKENDRLLSYLYNAQKAYGFSEGAPTDYVDPISVRILQLFYPDYKPNFTLTDNWTTLTDPIADKFEKRFKEEEANIHPFPIQERKDAWVGEKPYIGINFPSYKPWILKKADQFRLSAPPSPTDPFWMDQLSQVKKALSEVNEDKKKKILFWADPKKGNLIEMANRYLNEKEVPFKKQLEIRSILASTLLDASIATFDTKYAYLVRRPDQLDKDLKTVIPTPNHPSFPAAHAVYSYAAATILTHYFPDNKRNWDKMAEECTESRIWAGVHFPIDLEKGKELGIRVAENALQNR